MSDGVDITGWEEGTFRVARINREPLIVNGMKHPNGIGVHREGEESWALIHLNTGFGIVSLRGVNEMEALIISSEIATAGDWKFESLSGWQNRDPQLGSKVQLIVTEYEPCVVVDMSAPEPIGHQIAMADRVRNARPN